MDPPKSSVIATPGLCCRVLPAFAYRKELRSAPELRHLACFLAKFADRCFLASGLSGHSAIEAALSAVDKARPRDSALYLGQELASSATGRHSSRMLSRLIMSLNHISGLLSRRMQMRSRGKISGPMESQACAYFMAQLCNVWGPGAACIATCCKPRASAAARLKFCCVLRAGRTSADSFYSCLACKLRTRGVPIPPKVKFLVS